MSFDEAVPLLISKIIIKNSSWPCGPTGLLSLLLTKEGDVQTNPGPSTSNKRVWIRDICYKQIHARKQISIGCNIIEHNTQIPGPAIYTDNPDSQLTQT